MSASLYLHHINSILHRNGIVSWYHMTINSCNVNNLIVIYNAAKLSSRVWLFSAS